MWKKAESATVAQTQIKFKSVKREGFAFNEKTNRRKDTMPKQGPQLNTTKSRRKTRTIDPKNAEKELK